MSAATADRYLVFVSTQCIDSGEIGNGPFRAVFDSRDQAVACFTEQVATSQHAIEKEIAKIAAAANGLVFESPYTMEAALFTVPSVAADSAENAKSWITGQLNESEDLSEHVIRFEGFSVGPKGRTATSLDNFLAGWC